MQFLRRLVHISRPVMSVPALAGYAAGVLISGHTPLSASTLLGALFVTVPMGLIIYGINDIADRESDARNPRKGGVDGARLQQSEEKPLQISIVVTVAVSLGLCLLLGAFALAVAVAFICLFGYTYSAKPIRLKERPVLDSLSNGAWVLGVVMAGYWAAVPRLALPFPSFRLLGACLLFGAVLHALGAAIDYKVDKATGDTTIAVALGVRTTILLCVAALAACLVLLRGRDIGVDAYMAIVIVLTASALRNPSAQYVRGVFLAAVLLFPLVIAARVLFG